MEAERPRRAHRDDGRRPTVGKGTDMKEHQNDLGAGLASAAAGLRGLPDKAGALMTVALTSIAAGSAVVAFIFLTRLFYARTYGVLVSGPKSAFVFGSLAVILASSLAAGVLVHFFSPEAAGSGVPRMKLAYWKDLGWLPWRAAAVKFAAGILSIGGGASLGWEGPSVFIGSAVASNVAGLRGAGRRERRGPALSGSSAGLAAAFNSPLAAITFAIEEVVGDLDNKFLGGVVLASVLGAFTVHAALGRQPAYTLPSVDDVSWIHYAVVPLAALVASLAGVAFQRGALALRARVRPARNRVPWLTPVFGGLVTWVLGVGIFLGTGRAGVFGVGFQDLSAALRNDLPWKVAGVICLAKVLASIASYGFGCCGGIFAPTLFIGGLAGCSIAGLAGNWVPLSPADHIVLAAVGMSSCLGTVMRAPFTSILIVFETTHQFALVPGLLIGIVVSQAVSRLAGDMNLDDALLVQDGHDLHRIRPPKDLEGWRKLPVGTISTTRPVCLTGLSPQMLKAAADGYPYNVFPVVIGGKLEGTLSRHAMLEAVESGRTPEVRKAVTCYPDQTVGEVGDRFLASPVNVLIVVGRADGRVEGIITLHDLIRAQAALAE